MTKDEYVKACVESGDTKVAAERTWTLMVAIQRVLDDKDVDPYMAPEIRQPKRARLARLFIDEMNKVAPKLLRGECVATEEGFLFKDGGR